MINVSKFALDEEATAIDKQRWLEATEIVGKGKITKDKDAEIRQWVACQEDGEYKTDMKRRLNLICNNRKK